MFLANLSLYRKMTQQRSRNLANKIKSLLPDSGKILDFGCGNGFLAETLLTQMKNIEIIGIDVIKDQNLDEHILKNPHFDFQIIIPDAPLPFVDDTFDAVIACAAMHHTNSPEYYLKELKRITKHNGHVILIEEMYHNFPDKIWISMQDWLLNKMKEGVPVPLQFRSYKHYQKEFRTNGLSIEYEGSIRPVFPYMHHYVFKLKKT